MDNFREEVAVKHNRTGNMILYGLSWIAIVALGFIALLAFSAIMAMQFTIPNFIQLGVCGGLAEYFALDPTVVRVATVLLAVFAGLSIWVYIIAALIMPKKSTIYPGY